MNIAYITADFGVPIFGYKGASIHVREMVAALCSAGHSVSLFSPAIDGRELDRMDRGSYHEPESVSHPNAKMLEDVRFFPVLPRELNLALYEEAKKVDAFAGIQTRYRRELRNLLYNLNLYETAAATLRDHPPDFVYERYCLFNFAGIRLARMLGVPHLLEVNAPLAHEQEKMRGMDMSRLANDTERRIFSESDKVLVVSEVLKQFVVSRGVPESRVHVLPNSVDPRRFIVQGKGASIRERLELDGKRVIGFVGSLKAWHGTDIVLQAFHNLHDHTPDTRLLIVGHGPERESLERYVRDKRLSESVIFTGNVPYDDIPQYIDAMDVTVAPYTRSENFYYSPIKLFEYMAMGKPVVAGRIGQIEELIEDGETGILVEPGSVTELTKALKVALSDDRLRERLGKRAKAWVEENRTWEGNAREVIEIASSLQLSKKGQTKNGRAEEIVTTGRATDSTNG